MTSTVDKSKDEQIKVYNKREENILETLRLVEGSSLWSITFRRMRRDQLGMFGFGIVIFLLALGIAAFLIQQYDNLFGLGNPTADPWDQNNYFIELWIPGTEKYIRLIAHPQYILPGEQSIPPCAKYPFGTDTRGYDIFSRTIFGTPLSLALGLAGQMATSVIGMIVGAVSGYYGGLFDDIIQRINEVIIGLPDFILFIFAVALFREIKIFNFDGGYYIIVLTILSLISWGGTSIIVRSTVLSLKAREFIMAEHALGADDKRIIFKHIIPNAMSPIIIITTLGIAGTIMSIAGLAFFGFGDPTAVSWGDDLAYHRDNLLTYWWMPTFPAMMIFLTMLGFNLLGDALRDALDPKLKR